jgi:hypothetical protein
VEPCPQGGQLGSEQGIEPLGALAVQAPEGEEREQGIVEFAAAAARLFTTRLPDRALPGPPEEVLAALAAEEPVPREGARTLAARRLDATRDALVSLAGIEVERLEPSRGPAEIGAPAGGRVEFEIRAGG